MGTIIFGIRTIINGVVCSDAITPGTDAYFIGTLRNNLSNSYFLTNGETVIGIRYDAYDTNEWIIDGKIDATALEIEEIKKAIGIHLVLHDI